MPLSSKPFPLSSVLLICLVLGLFFYEAYAGLQHAIYLWDESIYANNSLEMERSGRYLVYTVDWAVDHHNSKPPLVLWLQVLSYKIFGYNEPGVRAPSYLALGGTLTLCLYYARKLSGTLRPGIIACLVILLTPGLMRAHVFLSGDLDAMLVFWCSAIFLHHLKVIQRKELCTADIYIYAVLFVLAFLTKSTAVLMILPPLILSFLLSGQLRALLRQKAIYVSAALFVMTIAVYYAVREHYDPGYWDVVWYSEFSRVAVNIQPWLSYPAEMYFVNLWEQHFRHPLMLLAVAGPIYLLIPAQHHKKLFLHVVLISLGYLGMITIPPVKLVWYDAPVYPLLAFGIGLALSGVGGFILGRVKLHLLRETIWIITVSGLAMAAFGPFRERLEGELRSYMDLDEPAYALREFVRRHDLKQVRVLEQVNEARFLHVLDGLRFYQKAFAYDGNRQVAISSYINDIRPHEALIVCWKAKQDSLMNMLPVAVLDSCRSCRLFQVQ